MWCLSVEPKNITIFVHGSRGFSRLLFTYTDEDNKIKPIKDVPTKYVTHKIADSLAIRDPKKFPLNSFYVFGWSGRLNNKIRFEAAKILFEEICKLIENLKIDHPNFSINLITHSHGGNVALNLANVAKELGLKFKIDNLILLACPVQAVTSQLIHSEIFNNVYNIYSCSDWWQILDPQGVHSENKGKKVPLFSGRKFENCPKLKQVEVKFRGKLSAHAAFLTAKFFKRLPYLLNKMKFSSAIAPGR